LAASGEVIPNPQPGVAVVALSLPKSADDAFRENITIISAPVRLQTTAKEFLAEYLAEFPNKMPGFQEHGRGIKTVNGIEWAWIDYRQLVEGIESRVSGHITVRHGRAYGMLCGGAPDRLHAV
jgi:hypothetical protein